MNPKCEQDEGKPVCRRAFDYMDKNDEDLVHWYKL